MYILENELKLKEYAFAQRKNLPWELKLYLTENRIIEWADKYDGLVYVSFSGGLDSTVLLHFVRKVLGDEVPAVFCNTGLEYPELVEFVKVTPKVEIIKPKMSFYQVIKKYGYPVVSKEVAAKIRKLRRGKLSERYRNYLLNGDERGKFGMLPKKWRILLTAPFESSEICCNVMKKRPFKQYRKKTKRFPYIGITQDEGFIREHQYSKTGCNVYDSKGPKSQPLGFWTKQDILRYLYENHDELLEIIKKQMLINGCSLEQIQRRIHPWAACYGDIVKENGVFRTTGVERTGCMFCMFGCHKEKEPNRFQQMRHTHPQHYNYCMKDCEEGGLGLSKVLDYIEVPYGDYQMNIFKL